MDFKSKEKIFKSFCEECIIDRRPGAKLTISRLLTEDQSNYIQNLNLFSFIRSKLK